MTDSVLVCLHGVITSDLPPQLQAAMKKNREPRRCLNAPGVEALGVLLDGLELERRLVAAARVLMLAAMSANAASRSSRVAYQCSRCQPVPSKRAKVSVDRMLTRMPYGFGASSGLFRLCGVTDVHATLAH